MASISAEEAARTLLEQCLEGRAWERALLEPLVTEPESALLVRVVAEGLGDRFEKRLCDAYADIFCEAIARKRGGVEAGELRERYERVRRARRFDGDAGAVKDVYVLSRVTLGADVAVTSVMMDAARRRFPGARVHFVGPRKSWEMFAGEPGLVHDAVEYGRGGGLEGRLAVWERLKEVCGAEAAITIDPDSRLTQLGLLPVCAEGDYYFFESRAYGGESAETVGELARRWARETFGVEGARAFLRPAEAVGPEGEITVSLGVGENRAKGLSAEFERRLVKELARRGRVLLDKGAGGQEAARAESAAAGLDVAMWEGSFAGFAARIARSRLYVGYDSAGGHVAAASGVRMVSVFAGYAGERMFERWKPWGEGERRVVKVAPGEDEDAVWRRVVGALG